MKIVLDTNVLISGLLSPSGIPAKVFSLILNGKLDLVLDNRIFQEYTEVLFRKKFKFKSEWINPLLDYIKMEGEFVLAEPINIDFKDIDNRVFYEVLYTSKSDYLITGNLKHFPNETRIVSPSEFIDIYNRN